MSVMNHLVDSERPFTVDDLEEAPDDGRRYAYSGPHDRDEKAFYERWASRGSGW